MSETPVAVDWETLRTAAAEAMRHAYAPYSGFPVGAAALTDDGRIVSGCNIENASYGVTLCAECSLVSQLHMTGGGKLVAFACVDGDGAVLMPCGRCRQLLFEHSAEGMVLDTVSGVRTIDEVLPDAFGPRTLGVYQATHADGGAAGAGARGATGTDDGAASAGARGAAGAGARGAGSDDAGVLA